MECNKSLVLTFLLRFILASGFLFLFVQCIWKVAKRERASQITVEESDNYFPALNICPIYKEKSLIIKTNDNYTLEDLDKLPSLINIIGIKIEVYREGINDA